MKHFFNRVVSRIRQSSAIALLGDGVLSRVQIFFILIFRPASESAWKRSHTFFLRANNTPFVLTIHSHEELMLVYEIFCHRMYRISQQHTPTYVVDCGANVGISTLFLYTLFPTAKILAIEPNPSLFPRLQETLTPYSMITPIQCAVGGTDGVAHFFVSPHSTVASSLVHRAQDDTEYTVPVKTLETLMRENGFPTIDVLKFDIEGAEEYIFQSQFVTRNLKSFVGEVHEDLMTIPLHEFMGLMKDEFETTLQHTKKKGRFILIGHRKK